ncbi:MFS general substrate transporter, partial [Fomitiporia mediterranea MF3/22]|uniref:MFS general substrate transporter n=1 Tax=Fomitiporia mediterranea (strain MF3/22) TaxID=694068 RepID=UPI0004408CDC
MSAPSGAQTARPSSESECTARVVPATTQVAASSGSVTKGDPPKEHIRGGTKDFGFLPIPKQLQYDSERAFEFTTVLNITFGFASTFTVANLYYCQPLLLQLAASFNVTHDEISKVPTLVQAGYATGLLLLSPLGDLVRRRPLLLLLVLVSGTLSIGLATTSSFLVFETLSFIVGAFTVTPQVLIPLAADLAPKSRRASAISIVLSGLLFGVLLARVLAGVIAEFVTWRVVYYMAIGVQFIVLAALYLLLPDWPAKNAGSGVTYPGILYTMGKYAVTEPVLIQAGIMQFSASACFTNFWVTLTFLLGGPPYHYSTLDIGLFGLVGMLGVCTGPLVGRLIDRLVPWYATLVGTFIQITFQAVQTGAGGVNVGAVVIACFGLDVGRQMQQVSLTTAVYNISDSARSRMNAVLIIWIFLGQVSGTAAGAKIFLSFGWRAAAAFSLGLFAFQIGILFLRGPHCQRYTWFGYEGGIEWRKDVVEKRKRQAVVEKTESDEGKDMTKEKDKDEKKPVEDSECEKKDDEVMTKENDASQAV